MCFYPKNVRGLLAVECKFWKSRTAPVPTEQLHVIRDHRVTAGVTSPVACDSLSVLYPSNEWAEPFSHNFEGGSQVVKCCSVFNIPLPAPKSSRRGSLCHRPWSCTTLRQRVNAPARCIPGLACWVSAPTPAPCGHPPAPVTGLPPHPASTPRHLHPCLCKCPLEGIISCSF